MNSGVPPRQPSATLPLARRSVLRVAALAAALPVTSLGLLAGCAGVPKPDRVIVGRTLSRTRTYVQPDSVFEAALMDVSNENEPPIVLARQRVEPAGQAPYNIAIPFQSSDIRRGGKYVVQAQVSLYGELLLYTPGVHPVIFDPVLQRMDVILEPYPRTYATARAGNPFAQTHWQLVSLGDESITPVGAPAEGAADAFIQFHPAPGGNPQEGVSRGEFSGSGGCNRFLGSYQQNGPRLALSMDTTSIRLCLDGGKDESAFLRALTQVSGFMQRGRELVLRNQEGKPFLRFRALEAGEAAFEPYEPPNSQQ